MALMATEYCFVTGRLVGTLRTSRDLTEWGESAQFRHYAFACPSCGEVWGRRILHDVPADGWIFSARNCREHGDGSLLRAFDPLAGCDRDLLIYELTKELT